jgi:hypothetical protein
MHDCPNCRVPLHGHEEVCPSCGARQVVRRGFSSNRFTKTEKPTVNIVPVVIIVLVLIGGLFVGIQSSWIGQMMNRGPVQEDPMAKLTYQQARELIQTKITENLTAVGAKGKFNWTSSSVPVDMNANQPVELNVATRLTDKEQRHAIIDPIKDYMAKANIPTLTMTDSRSHATWTYTVSAPMSQPSDEDASAPAAGDTSGQPAPAPQNTQ